MDQMLCGLRDNPDARFEPELEDDDEILTALEKRLEWLCEAWKDAVTDNSFDEWYAVRMMIYGASQTIVYSKDRYDEAAALQTLSGVAFERGLECIREGKYEGAK